MEIYSDVMSRGVFVPSGLVWLFCKRLELRLVFLGAPNIFFFVFPVSSVDLVLSCTIYI